MPSHLGGGTAHSNTPDRHDNGVMAREESRGKRPFKIWDGFRNTRKSLLAASLNELESRGKEKLNIGRTEAVRLVLEADGTQIEDPDYFKTLPNNTTVLLLRDGESWSPAGVEAITSALMAIPKVVLQTIHSLKLQDETPSWKVAYNKGRVTVVLYWDQRCRHDPQESSARREQQPSTSGAVTPPLVDGTANIRLGEFTESSRQSVPATRGQAARSPVPHVVVMPSETMPGSRTFRRHRFAAIVSPPDISPPADLTPPIHRQIKI